MCGICKNYCKLGELNSMNVEEKIKILEESKIQIEKALKEQKKRAIKAAEKEAEYRKELAKEMYRLK